jgi:hypothetical protein
MEDSIIKEVMIEKYPIPVSIEKTKTILNQIQKSVCKIILRNGKGTGFFCKVNYDNQRIPIMITNYHVINQDYINKRESIEISINDDKQTKSIKLNNDRITYLDEEYDIAIIEIKPQEDNIHIFRFR